jgi:HAMP domain-containing protein
MPVRKLKFGIGTRLAIAIAIPLVIFVAFAGYYLSLTWQTRVEMDLLNQTAKGVADISRIIHELQRERGASAVYVGSKGAQMRAELPGQRKRTDEQRAAAGAFLVKLSLAANSDQFKDALAKATSAISALDAKRQDIDVPTITAQESNAYFTDTVAKLLAVAGEIAKVSSHSGTSTAISAYVSFMQGKERAGQERATGAAGISEGKFDLSGYVRVLGLRTAQESYFGIFNANATPAQQGYFQQTMSGPVVEMVAKMRDLIASGGMSGQMSGLDGKSWFDATTARIDLLKTVEDRLAADLVALTTAVQDGAIRTFTVLVGIVAAAFTFSGGIFFSMARGITRPLSALTSAMRRLGDGALDIVPPGATPWRRNRRNGSGRRGFQAQSDRQGARRGCRTGGPGAGRRRGTGKSRGTRGS